MIKKTAGIVTIVVVILVIAIGIAKADTPKVQPDDKVTANKFDFEKEAGKDEVVLKGEAKVYRVVVKDDEDVYNVFHKDDAVNKAASKQFKTDKNGLRAAKVTRDDVDVVEKLDVGEESVPEDKVEAKAEDVFYQKHVDLDLVKSQRVPAPTVFEGKLV